MELIKEQLKQINSLIERAENLYCRYDIIEISEGCLSDLISDISGLVEKEEEYNYQNSAQAIAEGEEREFNEYCHRTAGM